MRHFGGQCQHVLFREVHILGDAVLHANLLTTNMVSMALVAACDAGARGQYVKFQFYMSLGRVFLLVMFGEECLQPISRNAWINPTSS